MTICIQCRKEHREAKCAQVNARNAHPFPFAGQRNRPYSAYERALWKQREREIKAYSGDGKKPRRYSAYQLECAAMMAWITDLRAEHERSIKAS